jgi:hypothetical protein
MVSAMHEDDVGLGHVIVAVDEVDAVVLVNQFVEARV